MFCLSLARPTDARVASTTLPARAQSVDLQRRIDVNQINMWVTNVGSFGFDVATGNAGLVYPKGSGRTALFAAGLWLGGRVGGDTRVTVAYYDFEYGPGSMVGGAADDPARPEYRMYKVARWTGLPTDSAHVERTTAERAADPHLDSLAHHSWSEYMAEAVPHGAPWRLYRLPNAATGDPADSVDVPGPDVLGDQMLWCVFNDADPALHNSGPGRSAPLGIEVRQTVFAYDRPGPLGSTVFLRYELTNKGNNTIEDMRTSMWGDFDIGFSHDDLAGCMESRSVGYMYNSQSVDDQYGYAVPAIGIDLLNEHYSATLGRDTGMDAFTRYIDDSAEPFSASESFNALQGLQSDGSPIIDPVTGQTTTFMVTGDPLLATGWVDRFATDRRFHCSSGPWRLAPGDSLTLWVALVIGQADSPLGSIAALRCADDYVQSVFDAGFAEPLARPPVCFLPPTNCPRSSDWWAEHCGAGTGFTASQWLAIARFADSTSVVFDFGDPGSSSEYCAILSGPWSTARDSAKREYLALLSNVAAGELGLVPSDQESVRLLSATEVRVPPLLLTWVGAMIQDKPDSIRLADAFYDDRIPDHRRAYTGVNFGLPFFDGGAGYGWDFFGGTLDPGAMRDSFATVELRFHRTATQKAYRFLRHEKVSDGSAPPGGRGYTYGGFHTCNLQAWDVVNGVQLDIAFVERLLTAADGTILPDASQLARTDSTWNPSDDPLGDREYLFVLRRPYGETEKAEIARDGALVDESLPLLYTLIARLRAPHDVVDDGDAFRFVFGYPPTGSAERLFIWLEPLPLSDSLVVSQYRAFAAGTADVNGGLGIGAVCEDPTPVPATLIEARTEGSTVTLRWLVHVPVTSARLEIQTDFQTWIDAGPARVTGNEVTATDFAFASGRAYRLALAADIGLAYTDPISLAVPSEPPTLALVSIWSNPSTDGRPRVEFILPGPGIVRLDVHDLAGRRVTGRDMTGLSFGTQLIQIAPETNLTAGVYFIRLRFGAEQRVGRFVVLN